MDHQYEFLHADDLGKACVFALQYWTERTCAPLDAFGRPLAFLNVGTGIDLGIRQLAEYCSGCWLSWSYQLGFIKTGWHSKETVGCESTAYAGLEGLYFS